MNYEIEELLPVVGWLAEKYTSGESTSVTYEKANQLMEAVRYCIQEFEMADTSEGKVGALVSEKAVPARTAYDKGYDKVVAKTKKASQLYNEMIGDFHAYGNKNYHETATGAFAGFFKCYDARFAPQDTIITMDYPTLWSVGHLSGIDAVERYLIGICLEQRFLSMLPEKYIYSILQAYQKDYGSQFYNICNIIVRHVLGCMIAGKPLGKTAEKEDYDKLGKYVQECSKQELREKLERQLQELIEEKYEDDEVLFLYLSSDLDNFTVELKNAEENGCLSKAVVL